MVFRNLIFQPEVVEQRLRPVVLSHHDQQASDDQNQTEHGQMLSSNMLLLNLILLIDVTFSTPTPDFVNSRMKLDIDPPKSILHDALSEVPVSPSESALSYS